MSEASSASTERSVAGARTRVLWLSTTAFTLLFAVWLMLGLLSIKIRPEFGLTDGQLYTLTLVAILAGSLLRFHFGVWTDRYGGRKVLTTLLLFTVIPTLAVSLVSNYTQLLVCAALFGLAGNSFSIGIAWCAAWFPKDRQGLALGVFGAGNVGASVTKLFGPALIAAVPAGFLGGVIPGGWRFIPVAYSGLLVLMACAVWFLAPKDDRTPARGKTFTETIAPIRKLRVWEYSLHYVVVFGAYVALSNLLPTYYFNNFGRELAVVFDLNEKLAEDFDTIRGLKGEAYTSYMVNNPDVKADSDTLTTWIGVLAAVCFVFPASLLRPFGGWLSDRFGPQMVMHSVFWSMTVAGSLLTFVPGAGVCAFTAALFVLGVGMGIGKASVYKMIPDAFPKDVGAVGGLVGLLGAVGGVLIPLFAAPVQTWLGQPQVVFGVLLGLTLFSLGWFSLAEMYSAWSSFRRPTVGVALQALPATANEQE
jgi:NNP family nitrate/nitrite transporter-like MFS transporter